MELTVRVIHVNIQQTDQANHFLKTGKVTTQIIFCFPGNNMVFLSGNLRNIED